MTFPQNPSPPERDVVADLSTVTPAASAATVDFAWDVECDVLRDLILDAG